MNSDPKTKPGDTPAEAATDAPSDGTESKETPEGDAPQGAD